MAKQIWAMQQKYYIQIGFSINSNSMETKYGFNRKRIFCCFKAGEKRMNRYCLMV